MQQTNAKVFFMKPENTEVSTISDLAKAYRSSDYKAYQRMIKEVAVNGPLKKVLMNKGEISCQSKDPSIQAEEIGFLKTMISAQEALIEEQEKACQVANEKFEKMRKELIAAKEQFQKAREEKENAIAIKKCLQEENAIKRRYMEEKKKQLWQLNSYLLVHPSATLSSLNKKQGSIIVCTKYDLERMEFRKFTDSVFESSEPDMLTDEVLQESKKKFDTVAEFISAREYVKMVVTYWAEDKKYELLYNSAGIRYMLKALSLE